MARVGFSGYSQVRKVKEVAQNYDSIRMQGFKGMICRVSNIKVIKLLEPFGVEIIKESKWNTNGKNFSLYLIILDLQSEKFKDFIEMTKTFKEDELNAKL